MGRGELRSAQAHPLRWNEKHAKKREAVEVTGKWMKLHEQHLCMVCGDPKRPCQVWEKNTDGTYAHADCLRPHSLRPVR